MQLNAFAAVLLTVAGWAHARIFALEGQLAATREQLTAVQTAQQAGTRSIETAIAELKSASAEQRTATARLDVAIAELRWRRK